jgi:hypothetical protein
VAGVMKDLDGKLRHYLTIAGSWAALFLGIGYLVIFFLHRNKVDFAIGIAFLSLSMAIKAYGRMMK